MVAIQKTFLALSLLLVPFLSPAQTLSASKLSAHLIGDYTAGSSNIVAGHPRVLKVLALDSGFPSGMTAAMRNYKAVIPTGKLSCAFTARTIIPRTTTLPLPRQIFGRRLFNRRSIPFPLPTAR